MNGFESHINATKPVVVDFSATWSESCKLMDPVFHELKDLVGDRATILKVDIDKSPYYSNLYNIQTVPTIIIFKEGNIIWRKSGVAPAHEIFQQLAFHIS